MTRDAAERIVYQWDNHDCYRMVEGDSVPDGVAIARAYLSLLELLAEAIARFRTEGQTIFADYLERQLQSAGEGEG
jgi:hypothetical protein